MMRHLLTIVCLLLCISCSTVKYVDKPVPVETTKIEYVNKLLRDSIYIHDSIDRYVSQDTVYQYKYKYIYKYLIQSDTIIRNDTIEKPVEVKTIEVKEVSTLKWYHKIGLMMGGLFTFTIGFILSKKL